jgi:hypothetical protein
MKLSLPPKLVGKLVWVSVTSFCKISFPIKKKHLMPYYAESGRSRPPHRLTLWITLIFFALCTEGMCYLQRFIFCAHI